MTLVQGNPCSEGHKTTDLQQQLLQQLQGPAAYNEEDGMVGPWADVDTLPILHGAQESEGGCFQVQCPGLKKVGMHAEGREGTALLSPRKSLSKSLRQPQHSRPGPRASCRRCRRASMTPPLSLIRAGSRAASSDVSWALPGSTVSTSSAVTACSTPAGWLGRRRGSTWETGAALSSR